MDAQKQICNISSRDIASQGGNASSGSFEAGDPRAREAGQRGCQASSRSFAPGDPRAREAGHKGGLSGPED
ncbi:uncharacterized protein N7458_007552 [Penicillium daleae]|uniref:Uncharacterized protein n=1 Tax=Penicillium daleae TaxID=63821 RepID=A0AAD6G173_9EURO|nr:uncharacterized protein N7458_007552 [Penicillium daleae]KAJ5443680.1 hypothetical protein N7458_007552 [Penicillium daleae]